MVRLEQAIRIRQSPLREGHRKKPGPSQRESEVMDCMPSGRNITANPYERKRASCVWVRARTSSASRRTKTSESEFTAEPVGPKRAGYLQMYHAAEAGSSGSSPWDRETTSQSTGQRARCGLRNLEVSRGPSGPNRATKYLVDPASCVCLFRRLKPCMLC